jgi:integrase
MIFQRGKGRKTGPYWYKFMYRGEEICETTRQKNAKVAREIEAAHLTSLAKGEVGLREKCRMTLEQFIKERFEPWARSKFELAETKTWKGWYEPGILTLLAYPTLSKRGMSEITGEHIDEYAASIQTKGLRGKPLQAGSVNSRLRVLRRIFRLAVEWRVLDRVPKVNLVSGERHREYVLDPKAEAKYLAAASPLLVGVATVLIDSGQRPEECYRQRWENIGWSNGRHGTIRVTHGKTKAARRTLPLTARGRAILEQRWAAAGQPQEGWIWAAATKSGHIEPSTLKKQHRAAIKLSKLPPFVLYSLRHTFLTRLGASGCDVWTLARIAGHSSIQMSYRYVHPTDEHVLDAMAALFLGTASGGGVNFRYSPED